MHSSHQAARPAGMVAPAPVESAAFKVLLALSLSHGLNDTIQALLPSIYPMLKTSYGLTFAQVGLITFVFQLAGSLLQPFVGAYTDRRPLPYSLPVGMGITMAGLFLLSRADSFAVVLISAGLVGTGSAIFHPEASRLARLASGGRHGFAQSLFQVGGNFGSSLGPLLAAWIVVPRGQAHVLWFTLIALAAIVVLTRVGGWYQARLAGLRGKTGPASAPLRGPFSRGVTLWALFVLGVLIFSKFIYLTSLTSYYTFYLIERFGISLERAQYYLFIFLFASAVGTIVGGPVGDRWGRKIVIWISILGVAPFSLALPHVGLVWCGVLSAIVGVILASAFSAILVYAQEMIPGKVGLVSGLFFGSAFGMAAIGSAVLGKVADETSIGFVFDVCGYLPLLGVLTAFLPDIERRRRRART
ncbi:MAG: MFS transporter [Opitutaceae bacterium]